MSNSYIQSSDIYAFPVGTRGSNYPLARLTTEQNLVNIIRSVTDISETDGFVITGSGTKTKTSESAIEFIVGGYYFRTSFNSLPSATNADQKLYACVTIVQTGGTQATYNQEVAAQGSTTYTLSQTSTGVYADMNQVTTGDETTDDGTNFIGISFAWSGSKPSGYSYALPILYYDGTNYSIKEEYRYKIKRDSVNMEWIDLTV